jgi:hypothetical protein
MGPSTKKQRHGHPTWVTGNKFMFPDQYGAEWQKATDTSLVVAGKFYTTVTKRFIKKFGWHFNCWTDKECPDLDPATQDEDDSQDGLSEDEIAKRQAYYRELCNVHALFSVLTCLVAADYSMDSVYHVLVSLSLRQS